MSLTSLIYIAIICYVQVIAQDGFLTFNNKLPDDTISNRDLQETDLIDFEIGFSEEEYKLGVEYEWGWGNEEHYWPHEEQKNLGEEDLTNSSAQTIPNQGYLLPPATSLPGREGKPMYTLVLDMDETLLHSQMVNGNSALFNRPHAEEFLKDMNPFYEIVIWTANVENVADSELNKVDPFHYIDSRIYYNKQYYKESNQTDHGTYIKDLSWLGRDLSKTVFIDNKPRNFQRQPDNGLPIVPYYGAENDTALLDFVPFLRSLVEDNVSDVRPFIVQHKKDHNEA